MNKKPDEDVFFFDEVSVMNEEMIGEVDKLNPRAKIHIKEV